MKILFILSLSFLIYLTSCNQETCDPPPCPYSDVFELTILFADENGEFIVLDANQLNEIFFSPSITPYEFEDAGFLRFPVELGIINPSGGTEFTLNTPFTSPKTITINLTLDTRDPCTTCLQDYVSSIILNNETILFENLNQGNRITIVIDI